MNWTELIRYAKKHYGLKNLSWFYDRQSPWAGECYYLTRTIKMNATLMGDPMNHRLSVFFHELGHLHCYDTGKWKSYHTKKKLLSKLNKKEKALLVRTALKAERWVEKWAEREMAKHFPGVDYIRSYDNPASVKTYKEQYLSQFK